MSLAASHWKMQFRPSSCRLLVEIVAVGSFLGVACCHIDAQTLPATAPTSLPSKNMLPAPIVGSPAAPATSAGAQPHRASVSYAAGMLDVRANDSSLNQILREISRLTGMKITGGVADQRVFGNYGPAEPSTILATLLDGTGSNMVLRETADNVPAELVITPRNGGATPPNPNAPGFDDGPADDDGPSAAKAAFRSHSMGARAFSGGQAQSAPARVRSSALQQTGSTDDDADAATAAAVPQRKLAVQPSLAPATPTATAPVSIPQPLNDINGSAANVTPTASEYPVTNSVSTDSLPTPSTTPATAGIVDTPNPPAAGGTTAGSLTPTGNVEVPATASAGTAAGGTAANGAGTTGGASTPEQIFQQLQALRQQQQQSGSSTTPVSTTPTSTTPAPK